MPKLPVFLGTTAGSSPRTDLRKKARETISAHKDVAFINCSINEVERDGSPAHLLDYLQLLRSMETLLRVPCEELSKTGGTIHDTDETFNFPSVPASSSATSSPWPSA